MNVLHSNRIGALALLASAGLAACSAPRDGTAVGNPGHLDVSVEPPVGVSVESALFRVAAIQLVSCAERGRGQLTILPVDTTFDGLNPSPVEVPPGAWCTTILLPDGADSFVMEGTDPDGLPFLLGLDPDPFVFDGAYAIDGNQVVVALQLADISADVIDSVETTESNNESLEPPVLLSASGLFADDDADGRVGEGDLQLAEPIEPTGCGGCSTRSGGATSGWVALTGLAGMLGWRRRPRRPHRPATGRSASSRSS
jgi:MYXO-CTERM domain-containing protein